MSGAAGNFYSQLVGLRRTVWADVLLLAADVLLDVAVLCIFFSRPSSWILSLNAIGIILNILNLLVEGVSFNIPAAVMECARRNEYTPAFLRILLSEAMYEAGAASLVQFYALVEVEGLSWLQSLTLLASGLLSVDSLARGRMMCGIDVASTEGPFKLRAFTMMSGYQTALWMRRAEIAFRITSMAILMTALHPVMAATLLADLAAVAWGYFLQRGDLSDTMCFTITGAPLLLLSWQGGAVFGRHALDGRVWFSVTLLRVIVPFAYLAAVHRERFAARFPVGRLLVADGDLLADPPAVCRALVLALCGLSGVVLYGFVWHLGRFSSKLWSRDSEAERQHRVLEEKLKADFQAIHADQYWSASELGVLSSAT